MNKLLVALTTVVLSGSVLAQAPQPTPQPKPDFRIHMKNVSNTKKGHKGGKKGKSSPDLPKGWNQNKKTADQKAASSSENPTK